MLGRLIGVSVIFSAIALWVMLQMTAPSTAGPLGVLLVFIFLYVLVLGILTFLLFGASRLTIRFLKAISPKPHRPLTLIRSYYFSSVLSLAPVILLGMQSVGGASAYDIVLVLLFVTVACFYISKRTL